MRQIMIDDQCLMGSKTFRETFGWENFHNYKNVFKMQECASFRATL